MAAQTINLRIGWNPATSSVYWWTFDSEGGNASGPWARRGDEWVVTPPASPPTPRPAPHPKPSIRDGDSMVWSTTQRMLAGEARPDLIYRFVRRAPDPLSLLAPRLPANRATPNPPLPDGE
jgi:hypothetical protein